MRQMARGIARVAAASPPCTRGRLIEIAGIELESLTTSPANISIRNVSKESLLINISAQGYLDFERGGIPRMDQGLGPG